MEEDAVGPQSIGHGHRHVGVDGRLSDAHRRYCPRGELQLELMPAYAGPQELAKAESVVVVEDCVRSDNFDP
jgi:hypothetical protein